MSADNISKNLGKLMWARNLSDRQMAKAIDATCSSVCRWRNGQSLPGAEMLLAIAEYFEVTIDSLYQ